MIKVKFGKEIHILKCEGGLSSLAAAAKKVFKELPYSYHFVYRDEDDDEITVDCQEDFEVFLSDINEGSQAKIRLLKLQIREDIELLTVEEQLANAEIESINDEDSDGSIQVLQEREQFEVYSEQCGEQNESDIAYSSIYSQYSQIKDSQITEIVKQNILKMQNKLIESALVEQITNIQTVQINQYFRSLYEDVQQIIQEKVIEHQQKDVNRDDDDYLEEMSSLVQASLKKMLPIFFQQVSTAAIKNVRRIIQHEPLFSIPTISVNRE